MTEGLNPDEIVIFPEELECTWNVHEAVTKHYNLGSNLSLPVTSTGNALRKVVRLSASIPTVVRFLSSTLFDTI